jgi:uncharacterized protein DUF6580
MPQSPTAPVIFAVFATPNGFAYRAGRIDSRLMIPGLLLVLAAVAYRLTTGFLIHSGATWLSNFAPMAAIALCCAVYFPPKLKFSLPLIALFISDLVLNYHYGASLLDGHIIGRYLALVVVGCLGVILQNRASLKVLLPATILGSTIFYLMTCAFSWLSDPGYAKNFGGLIQAVTLGLPAYSATPAWIFFRNSLLSDLCFTVLFVTCMSFSRSADVSRAKTALPYTA